MAAQDWTAFDTNVRSAIIRVLKDTADDGFDFDMILSYGNKLVLRDTNGDDVEIYVSGTTLTLPATSATTTADNVNWSFGSGSDVTFMFDGTKFQILCPVADDTEIEWGDGTESFDHEFFFAAAGNTVYFDASANTVTFNGVDLYLLDADNITFGDSQDAILQWDATILSLTALADDQVFKIGNGTNSWDIWFYGNTANDNVIFDASANLFQLDGIDLYLEDDDNISFGNSQDVVVQWAAGGGLNFTCAADNSIVTWGETGNSFDHVFVGSTTSSTMTFDCSEDELVFEALDLRINDTDLLNFGDSKDVEFQWTNAKFTTTALADDYVWEVGDGTQSLDLKWFFETSNNYVYFDASADLVYFEAVDLRMNDDDYLYFGDSSDVGIIWTAAGGLKMSCAVDDSVFEIGISAATQKSFDVKIYGQAANGADYFLFDASASTLSWAGAASMSIGVHTMALIVNKTADYTVVAADSGTFFTNTGDADDIEYTLPALAAGLHFWFTQQTDNELKVTSPEGNNIVSRNDLTATSVAYTTAGEQIGGWLEFICDGTSWYYTAYSGGTGAEFTVTVA